MRGNSQQANSPDCSSRYINELEDVMLFCIRETIIDDFVKRTPSGAERVDLQMISNQLLMPFFQIRTRILERGTTFKIGDIEFYVASCEPHEFGKVTSKSVLRCTQAV